MGILELGSFWENSENLVLISHSCKNALHLKLFFFYAFGECRSKWLTHHVFRRAERCLLAQGHVQMISLFPRPWHPSAFYPFRCNFSEPIVKIVRLLNITTTGSLSTILRFFLAAEICFRWNISDKNFNFRAKGLFLSAVCTGIFEELMFLQNSMEHHSVEQ